MALPIIIAVGTPALFLMIQGLWIPFIFMVIISAFILHMFATTYYVIESECLKLYCGFLYRKTLPINSISRIVESTSLINGPATSFRRLEIFYNRFDSVLVSPANKEAFLKELISLNPAIDIDS